MLFLAAISMFFDANFRGLILGLSSHDQPTLGSQRLLSVMASVRTTVDYFIHLAANSGDDTMGSGIAGNPEVTPLLRVLPAVARSVAERHGQDPDEAVYAATIFVATVTGRLTPQLGVCDDEFLWTWRGLLAGLRANGPSGDHRQTQVRLLRDLQNVAVTHGVLDPRDLPDLVTVKDWLADEALREYARKDMLVAYRIAHAALPDASRAAYPTLRSIAIYNERGIRMIRDLPQRLAAQGCTRAVEEMTLLEIIAVLNPMASEELRVCLVRMQDREYSTAATTKMVSMASHFLGAVFDLAAVYPEIDPHSFSFLHLFTQMLPMEATDETTETTRLVRLAVPSSQLAEAPPTVPVARRVLDFTAHASYDNSHLTLTNGRWDGVSVPYYTPALRDELANAVLLVRLVYEARLPDDAPAAWDAFIARSVALEAYVRQRNERRFLSGRKDKRLLLRTITWPQAVFIGLPMLLREALDALRDYRAAMATTGAIEQQRRTRERCTACVLAYLVPAIMLNDGMRPHNYAGGLVNDHLRFDLRRDGAGNVCGIENVLLLWRGDDEEGPRLKMRRSTEDGLPRSRPKLMDVALVHQGVLFDYLTALRPWTLAALGIIGDVRDYRLETDQSGLFVHAESTDRHGRYTEQRISQIFGESLHRMARTALGRELPDWDAPELMDKYHGLFAGHSNRLLFVSYHGGIRGQWYYARYHTDTTEAVARQWYSAVQDVMIASRARLGWEHPHYFDDLWATVTGSKPSRCDRPLLIDWTEFDHNNPEQALEAALRRERLQEDG